MKNCFEIDSNSSQGKVDYFLTDHLGSVRVIVDGDGKVLERNDYYPFGARHARSDYSQLAANRYKYNGKEQQVTGDLKYLDYGARMYDSGLGRWFNVDPKLEKYASVSPYTYCVNNPMCYIDPDGEEISNAMFWSWILQMISRINDKWSYYQEEKDRLLDRMNVDGISDKKMERLMRKYTKLDNEQNLYEEAFDEIFVLAKSSQLYDLKTKDGSNISGSLVASTGFENGVVIIYMPEGGNLGLFSHELKHAYQFEVGKMSFGKNYGGLYDQMDEVEAYARGSLFGGDPYSSHRFSVNYEKVQQGPVDVTNHPNIKHFLENSVGLKKVAKAMKHTFRYQGKTYAHEE